MPKMGLVTENETFQEIDVNSVEEAEIKLGGPVKTLILNDFIGMYVREGAALDGHAVNHPATYMYCIKRNQIHKIFGTVLVFGIDTSDVVQDLPDSARKVIMANVFEVILMGD